MMIGGPRLVYGAILPDLQQLGVSEDNPGLRAVYGFKAMMPLYPFVGVFTFISVLQDKPLRQQFQNDVQLIRYGMKLGFQRWIPIALGSATFYGLEVALRPTVYRMLGIDVENDVTTKEGRLASSQDGTTRTQNDADANGGVWQKAKQHIQQITGVRPFASQNNTQAGKWKNIQVVAGHRDIDEGENSDDDEFGIETWDTEDVEDSRNHERGTPDEVDRQSPPLDAPEDSSFVAPRYFPPIVGSQMLAGFVAASLMSLPNFRSLGIMRLLGLGILGMFAGTMVPSYESAMANKKY